MKSGILLIDKPQGITSHDVVDIARKRFGLRRIGHAGSLDPLATGLLIILVDRATKEFNRFMNLDKEYQGSLKLGASTDSGDAWGKIIETRGYPDPDEQKVLAVFKELEGIKEMLPPMVSALKYKGEPLYKLARKGITVARKVRPVKIYSLKLLKLALPEIEFSLKCSKGTYVRSLAEEIAQRLDSLGHIISLRRTSIGSYLVSEAKDINTFNENDIRPF